VIKEEGGTLGTICIYQATDVEAVKEHAKRVDMPADEILEIADTVIVRPDPQPRPPKGQAALLGMRRGESGDGEVAPRLGRRDPFTTGWCSRSPPRSDGKAGPSRGHSYASASRTSSRAARRAGAIAATTPATAATTRMKRSWPTG
jgi:hypothetical protein